MTSNFPAKTASQVKDEAIEALYHLDPGMGRTEWVSIGLSAKAGGIDFDTFDSWSAQGGNYAGKRSMQTEWKNFRPKEDGSEPFKVIFKRAYEAGWPGPRQNGTYRPGNPGKQAGRTPPSKARQARPAGHLGYTAGSAEELEAQKRSAKQKQAAVDEVMAAALIASDDHPYLLRKQAMGIGLYELPLADIQRIIKYPLRAGKNQTPLKDGRILIAPLHNGDGKAKSLEFIDEDGTKTLFAGVQRIGLMWTMYPLPESLKNVYIAEGIATTFSAEVAVSEACISAGSKANIQHVAKAIRGLYPGVKIFILADLGDDSIKVAQEAARSVWGVCITPDPEAMPPGGTDFNDMHVFAGLPAVTHWILRHSVNPDRPTLMGARNKVEIDYVLPGLELGTLGLIVGQGAAGKTFFAMELAISMALGRCLPRIDEVFWCSGSSGSTALVLGEDSYNQLNNRLFDIADYFKLDDSERVKVDSNLEIHSHVGADMLLIQAGRDGITETAFVDYLMHICSGRRLVVIDPLVRLHDADENDNTAISRLMLVLTRIARYTNCSIILLHHTGKGGHEGAGAARGASAISTSARWQVNATLPSKEDIEKFQLADKEHLSRRLVKFTGVKMNYGAGPSSFWMTRENGGVLVHCPSVEDWIDRQSFSNKPPISKTITRSPPSIPGFKRDF